MRGELDEGAGMQEARVSVRILPTKGGFASTRTSMGRTGKHGHHQRRSKDGNDTPVCLSHRDHMDARISGL